MSDLALDRGLPVNLDVERFVLGAVLMDETLWGPIAGAVSSEDFSLEKHRRLFLRMGEIHERGERIDRVTLANELKRLNQLESVDGLSYIVSLDEGLPALCNFDQYVRILQEKSTLRRLILECSRIQDRCFLEQDSPGELISDAERLLREMGSRGANKGNLESVRESLAGIDLNQIGKVPANVIRTPYGALNRILVGFAPGELIVMGARPSSGKAQPGYSRVLTRSGWKRIDELTVGEELCSVDGERSFVKSIQRHTSLYMSRVHFRDGRHVDCCEDHHWSIGYRDWDSDRVVTTQELRRMMTCSRYQGRLYVPVHSGEVHATQELPIDPWLLGVLIGEGSFLSCTLRLTTPDQEIVDGVAALIAPEYELTRDRLTYSVVKAKADRIGKYRNKYITALRDLGLWGKRSTDKFIPEIYKRGDRDQRERLLCGLIDTDGSVSKCGHMSFSSASERLAKDVQELAWSLGFLSRVKHRKTRYTHANGERSKEFESWRVSILNPSERCVSIYKKHSMLSDRKSDRLNRLTVTLVEPLGMMPGTCIEVSHPTGLYITDNYVVTHNSACCLEIAIHACMDGRTTALFSLEMSRQAILTRAACNRGQVDNMRVRHGALSDTERYSFMRAMSEIGDLPLYLDDRSQTLPAMMQEIRRMPSKPHLVIIDHLHLMRTVGRHENRNNELAAITRELKLFAGESGCAVLLLAQLNRTNEKETRPPELRDLRDCGAIEQDADVVLFLHKREDVGTESQKVGPVPVDLIVAKQREGVARLRIPLMLVGKHYRFHEIEQERSAA